MKQILFIFTIFICTTVLGQSPADEYKSTPSVTSLKEAKEDPSAVTKLVLKKKKFKVFPKEIFELENLEYLDLSKNKIDSIPADISKLTNLKVIILTKNKIQELPNEFYQLKKLQVIRIGSNEVGYISKQIENFTDLVELDLWNTNVGELPYEISLLKKLDLLDLRGILLNQEKQEDILELLPEVKVLLSPPCNCGF